MNTGNIPALLRLGVKNHVTGNIIGAAAYNATNNNVQLGDYNFDYALGQNGKNKTDSTKVAYDATKFAAGSSEMSFYSELADVMAGGWLVYCPAPDSNSITFSDPAETSGETLSVTHEVKNVYSADNAPTGAATAAAANGAVSVTAGWVLNYNAPEGYYIFRRQIGGDGTDTTKNYAYSGFYFVPGATAGAERYYRLTMQDANDKLTNGSDLPAINQPTDKKNSIAGVSAATDTGTVALTSNPTLQTLETFDTNAGDTNAKAFTVLHSSAGTATDDEILVVVDVKGDDALNADLGTLLKEQTENSITKLTGTLVDDLIFQLKLAEEIAETTTSGVYTSKSWTAIIDTTLSGTTVGTGDNKNLGYAYYNTKLDPGQTTPKFVDSVTFDSRCTGGYANFDYDIDVLLDSIQITYDANNNEIAPGGGAFDASKHSVADKVGGWTIKVTVTDDKTTDGEITASGVTNPGDIPTTGLIWEKTA